VKTTQSGEIEVSVRVPGKPEEVFPYFTEPEKYTRWKGLEADLDPRPGGIYRVKMLSGVWVEGEYLEVERPRRLVFSWGWRGEPLPAMDVFADVPPGSSTVEVDFIPDGDGTIIRLRHTGLPTAKAGRFHTWGWSAYLPRLERTIAEGDPGPPPDPTAMFAEWSNAENAYE
jgi:uncharacterized protein YndB with AHSA1/START domain